MELMSRITDVDLFIAIPHHNVLKYNYPLVTNNKLIVRSEGKLLCYCNKSRLLVFRINLYVSHRMVAYASFSHFTHTVSDNVSAGVLFEPAKI